MNWQWDRIHKVMEHRWRQSRRGIQSQKGRKWGSETREKSNFQIKTGNDKRMTGENKLDETQRIKFETLFSKPFDTCVTSYSTIMLASCPTTTQKVWCASFSSTVLIGMSQTIFKDAYCQLLYQSVWMLCLISQSKVFWLWIVVCNFIISWQVMMYLLYILKNKQMCQHSFRRNLEF